MGESMFVLAETVENYELVLPTVVHKDDTLVRNLVVQFNNSDALHGSLIQIR